MNYLGDFAEDVTVYAWWDSNDGDGASITRATDGTIKVRRDDGTDCTGSSVTDTEDTPDTGVHSIAIDSSDSANFAVGHDYLIWLDGATVDSQVVNAAIASFSIENRFAEVDLTQIGGVAQSATDLKDFADTGYDPSTHVAKADLHYILAHLLTQTGTQVADAFQTMYDVASPVLVASDVMRGTDSAATAAKLLAYMQVLTRSDPAIKADRSTELAELNTDEGSGAGDYDNAKAALEAIAEPMLIGTVASRTDDTDFTLTATDLTGNDDDHNGQLLVFVTGNNAGLMRIIGDYTGSTDRVQFTGTGFLAGFPNLVQVGDVCRVLSAAI